MDAAENRPAPDPLAEVRDVVGRARSGDAAAVPRLRELLDGGSAVWRRYGDLAAQVGQAWVNLAAGGDLLLRESVARYAARLRAELTRPGASPIEALLAERAAATWLQLHYFSAMEASALAGDAPPKLLQLRARRQGQAERAHARALSTLVAVQRLSPVAPAAEPAFVAVAEPDAVAAPTRQAAPAHRQGVGVPVEDQAGPATFRSTNWSDPTEAHVSTPGLSTWPGIGIMFS